MPFTKGHKSGFTGKTSKFKGKQLPERWKHGPNKDKQQVNRWYLMAKAQARFRDEPWDLTFDQYYDFWRGKIHLRGRKETSMSLTRIDDTQGWTKHNCVMARRRDAITRRV
jgi:hypothetical protein